MIYYEVFVKMTVPFSLINEQKDTRYIKANRIEPNFIPLFSTSIVLV